MQQRQIGDTKVSALGLGGMPMSIEGRPEESRSVATKGGYLPPGDGSWTLNDSPNYLRQACEASILWSAR
jgi:aryl-alcohol dehydrogenase-like predicted oxidoreductase